MTEQEPVENASEQVVISKEERRIFELNAICLDNILAYINDTKKIIEKCAFNQVEFLEYDTLILNSLMDRFIRIEKLVKESIND